MQIGGSLIAVEFVVTGIVGDIFTFMVGVAANVGGGIDEGGFGAAIAFDRGEGFSNVN